MAVFVALLRAINVGGTGMLGMAKLRELMAAAGFEGIATYIQSGNVVFRSRLAEAATKAKIEQLVALEIGKPVAVAVRTHAELEAVLAANPFPRADAKQLVVIFLGEAPPTGALDGIVAPGGEEVRVLGREVFVHYPNGMGHSKLKLPFAKQGTARNLNTVTKVAAMAAGLEAESPKGRVPKKRR